MVPNSREKEGEYQGDGRIPGKKGNIRGKRVICGRKNRIAEERGNIRGKGEYQGEGRIPGKRGNIGGKGEYPGERRIAGGEKYQEKREY